MTCVNRTHGCWPRQHVASAAWLLLATEFWLSVACVWNYHDALTSLNCVYGVSSEKLNDLYVVRVNVHVSCLCCVALTISICVSDRVSCHDFDFCRVVCTLGNDCDDLLIDFCHEEASSCRRICCYVQQNVCGLLNDSYRGWISFDHEICFCRGPWLQWKRLKSLECKLAEARNRNTEYDLLIVEPELYHCIRILGEKFSRLFCSWRENTG